MSILRYAPDMSKQRITITVDESLLAEVHAAISEGCSRTVSEWVCEAIEERQVRDRRLAALDDLISAYEAEHGPITDDELADQIQRDRDAAAFSRIGDRSAG